MKSRLFVLLLFVSGFASAQVKYEKETRIAAKLVPNNAIKFMQQTPVNNKLCWYKEQRPNGISYEAKFKYEKYHYSVEFNAQGEIEDVEKNVKWKSVEDSVIRLVDNKLNAEFEKYKVEKVQIQYVGIKDELITVFGTNNYEKTNLELIVNGKTDSGYQLFEYLFDRNGNVLSKLKIKEWSTNNLDF